MSPSKKKVVVLGSTGSIGESTIKVANDLSDRIEIIGIAACKSDEKLISHLKETGAMSACLTDPESAQRASTNMPDGVRFFHGEEGLIELATLEEADIVLISIVGVAGLRPALAALEAGKDLAVASKEILVMAGQAVMETAEKNGAKVLPVDSEHNAIFQCLEGKESKDVSRLILTASGGPFRKSSSEEIQNVSPREALQHPTWKMGPKITIDSATLFNKGLEMIEAKWLFDIDMNRVDVVVHPQSIIHSMVELKDGSVEAQMSLPSMIIPLSFGLLGEYSAKAKNNFSLDMFKENIKLTILDFPKDRDKLIEISQDVMRNGGNRGLIFASINDFAVKKYLQGEIKFGEIYNLIFKHYSVMEKKEILNLEDLKHNQNEILEYLESI